MPGADALRNSFLEFHIGSLGRCCHRSHFRYAAEKKEAKVNLVPMVGTFVATFVSGAAFSGLAVLVRGMDVMAGFVQFAPIVVCTALLNSIIVAVLTVPLGKAVKRN